MLLSSVFIYWTVAGCKCEQINLIVIVTSTGTIYTAQGCSQLA